MNSSHHDPSICNTVIRQRNLSFLFHHPPSRSSLVSPYSSYSQSQLDMRRKAEILQYSNNQSSSKTNNITKKQRWSQLANQPTGIKQSLRIANCPNQSVNESFSSPTLTTSSDVPGPPMMLYLDKNVPLYNYLSTSQRFFSSLPVDNVPFHFYYTDSKDHKTDVSVGKLNLGVIVFTRFASITPRFQIPLLNVPMGIFLDQYTSNISQTIYLSDIHASYFYSDMYRSYSITLPDMLQPWNTFSNITIQPTVNFTGIIFIGMLFIPSIIVYSSPNTFYEYQIVLNHIPNNLQTFQFLPNMEITSESYDANICSYTDMENKPQYIHSSFQKFV